MTDESNILDQLDAEENEFVDISTDCGSDDGLFERDSEVNDSDEEI